MSLDFIKELIEQEDLSKLQEGAELGTLTSSVEFQAINAQDPKVAKALKLQWGYPEFFVYVNKILAAVAKKDPEYSHITPDLKIDLTRLVRAHTKKFPKVVPPKAKAGAYKWDDENTDVRTTK